MHVIHEGTFAAEPGWFVAILIEPDDGPAYLNEQPIVAWEIKHGRNGHITTTPITDDPTPAAHIAGKGWGLGATAEVAITKLIEQRRRVAH
jgi:hypothetical protein